MILIAILLVVIIAFMGKFYFQQRKENKALRLKILSMSENRRTPKSWAQLMATPALTPVAPPAPAAQPTPAPPATTSAPKLTNEPLANLDTQTIAVRLNAQMKNVQDLDSAALDANIEMADEIISREPDSYGAYKAKLISILVKEGKFDSEADESEVEALLESMAQFSINTDRVARREAALMANANSDIRKVEGDLETLAIERENLENGVLANSADPIQMEQLNQLREELDDREALLLSNIDNLEQSVAYNTNQIVNEDIVEIPFMRMMAKNDYQAVMDNAQEFIDQFPNSPNGYFYLMRALELQGRNEEARSLMQSSNLPSDAQQVLLNRLDSEGSTDPKTYWKNLNF